MDNLYEFLERSKLRLQTILDQLLWTEEDVLRDFNTNSHSSVKEPETEHVEDVINDCIEPALSQSCADTNSVVLEEKELQRLLGDPIAKAPDKFSDLQINYSREQKLLLYEHTLKQKKESLQPPSGFEPELVSLADIVAMKRREKTKRRKYRISKPTQTEQVRSLVNLQMEALQQYFNTKRQIEEHKDNSKRKFESQKRYESQTKNEPHASNYKDYRNYENRMVTRPNTLESKKRHYNKFSEIPPRNGKYKEKYKSRSRSRSRNTRKRSRSRNRSSSRQRRKRSRSHSRKHKKEKHKKYKKRNRRDSSS